MLFEEGGKYGSSAVEWLIYHSVCNDSIKSFLIIWG